MTLVIVTRRVAIVDKLVDPIEIVSGEAIEVTGTRVAVHTPCSMQHGLGLIGSC